MVKKNNNETTLNDLANMVARGFENTATKDDLKELRAGLGRDINALAKKEFKFSKK